MANAAPAEMATCMSTNIIFVSRNFAKAGTFSRKKSVTPEASLHDNTMAKRETAANAHLIGSFPATRKARNKTIKMAPK